MDRLQRFYGVYLGYDRFGHQQVKTVSTVKSETLEHHGQSNLTLKRYLSQAQFPAQTFFIGRFQKSGSQRPVNFDRCADDLLRKLIDQHGAPKEFFLTPQLGQQLTRSQSAHLALA